jgi:hypothetical protein
VIFNGDMATNTKAQLDAGTDNVKLFRESMSGLKVPYYCVPGNHDGYLDDKWLAEFGYEKFYIIHLNGIDLIMTASFNDPTAWQTGDNKFAETDIPTATYDKIVAYLAASENEHAILVGHYPPSLTNTIALMGNEKVLCGFAGHVHDEVEIANFNGTGKPLYRDGHFSFIPQESTPWSYRILEVNNAEIKTYIVHPAVEYNTFTQEYERVTPHTLAEGTGALRVFNHPV